MDLLPISFSFVKKALRKHFRILFYVGQLNGMICKKNYFSLLMSKMFYRNALKAAAHHRIHYAYGDIAKVHIVISDIMGFVHKLHKRIFMKTFVFLVVVLLLVFLVLLLLAWNVFEICERLCMSVCMSVCMSATFVVLEKGGGSDSALNYSSVKN